MSPKKVLSALSKVVLAIAVWLTFTHNAAAQSQLKVLYSFTGGADGGGVFAGVVMDKQGNLYGTTSGGGDYGYGTVFELSPNGDGTWSESVLHSFMLNDPDGSEPSASPIVGPSGNLYGTAPDGGSYGRGTVFQLTPGSSGWALSVLYNFCAQPGCTDGAAPMDGLVMDQAGNLYGTAAVAFELTPGVSGWSENVLYTFCSRPGCTDGSHPYAGLTLGLTGELYGTTTLGGDPSCIGGNGCGVVYELSRRSGGAWREAVLHTFRGGPNDSAGSSQLIFDKSSNLYGTGGGGSHTCGGTSCGAVYKMMRDAGGHWHETVIYNFSGGAGGNGPGPNAGVVADQAGNLYGTTIYGGSGSAGVVYKLAPNSGGAWTYSVLHSFVGNDGGQSYAGLLLRGGKLYGTTAAGGLGGGGTVFEIIP